MSKINTRLSAVLLVISVLFSGFLLFSTDVNKNPSDYNFAEKSF